MKQPRRWTIYESWDGKTTVTSTREDWPTDKQIVRLLNAGERAQAEVKQLRAWVKYACCSSCGAEYGSTHAMHCALPPSRQR